MTVATTFTLDSAVTVAPATVRVTFSSAPLAISRVGATDGLRPFNYQLAGPSISLPLAVQTVPGDTLSLDVFTSAPLSAGTWTLLVLGVVGEDGTALTGQSTLSFEVSADAPQGSVNGGAQESSIEATLRQFLPQPAFSGEGWDAVIYALSTGDTYVSNLARDAFDQLFMCTASGRFLDRAAGEKGVVRPDSVGMSDEQFRELAIKMSTSKITYDALWRLLEIFYGSDAVRSVIETELDEPYAIVDETQLLLQFDGGDEVPITFLDENFAIPGQARAIEVAAVITRQMRLLDVQGWATSVLNPETQRYKVRIFSPSLGLASRSRVTGGLAQNKLRFPEIIDDATLDVATTFSVSLPALGVAVYNITGLADPTLLAVRIGDYVNISASALNAVNKGSFAVTAVSVVWDGVSTYTQSFTIANDLAIAQAGPLATTSEEDFVFFRSTAAALPSTQALISGAENDTINIELPASTVVVARELFSAAYLQGNTPVAIASAELTVDGVLTVTTSTAHGLAADQHILVDGLAPNLYTIGITAGALGSVGNPGTTASSQATIANTIRAPDTFAARYGHSMTTMEAGGVLIVGGETAAGTYSGGATTFVVTGTTLNPDGRNAYVYNYVNVTDCANVTARHAAVAVSGRLGIGVLRICGQTTADAPTALIDLFQQPTGTWVAVTNVIHPACWYLLGIKIEDAGGDEVVILSGGQTAAATGTAVTSRIQTDTGVGVVVAGPNDIATRTLHAGCAINSTHAMWAGGRNPVDEVPIASTFIVKYDGSLPALTPGPLAVARSEHSIVSIGNGRALAIGGLGRVLSKETVDRDVHEVEMFDMNTSTWTPAGRLRFPRVHPSVHVIGTKVYVMGGLDDVADFVFETEVYDLVTRKWSILSSSASTTGLQQQPSCVVEGFVYTFGGKFGGAFSDTFVVIPGANCQSSRHHLNRLQKVTDITSPTVFTVEGLPTGDYAQIDPAVDGAQITLVSAPEVDTAIGPYIWDTDEGPSLTNVSAEVATAIAIHAQVGILNVDDATEFPDEPGWLAFNAGYANQISPVRYLGRISDTQLSLDFEYRFPDTIPVGSTVDLLMGKGALDLAGISSLGSAYLTDASAGRIAAELFLRDAIACGPELNIRVKYPSDFGLGAAGSPFAGASRMSDAIRVWGGNELTAEVAAAEEEDDV